MGQMINRRRVMGGKSNPYDEYGYIKKGKVFHLDGIDKGNTANTWTDLIAGYTFPYNQYSTVELDGVSFSGGTKNAGWIQSEQTVVRGAFPTTTCTIECVFTSISGNCLFNSGRDQNITFALSTHKYHFFPLNTSQKCYSCVNSAGTHTVSLNNNLGVEDGQELVSTNATAWQQTAGYMAIGARNYGSTNPFTGKVFSIRIYNRLLTKEEMLHNQEVDNIRFNLGLNI